MGHWGKSLKEIQYLTGSMAFTPRAPTLDRALMK